MKVTDILIAFKRLKSNKKSISICVLDKVPLMIYLVYLFEKKN